MKVCGINTYNNLNEPSNKKEIICPPLISHLKIHELLSYSVSNKNSIWITKEGRAFCIGSNESNIIIGNIRLKKIEKETEIIIRNQRGSPYKFISAVSGGHYSLYLLLGENGENNQLAYVYKKENKGVPLFLNLNNHNPKYLFGGCDVSVAVCSDGSMFVITKSVFKSPNDEMESFYLPNDEKPISIAVCIDCFVAVGSKGGVYESPLNRESICRLILLPIKELEGKSIINVSGYYKHVFAVSQDGKVFGRGNNSYNRLGFGKLYDNYDKFVIIPNLDKHKIISSYAGCGHSLFLTSEGKVLACGANHYGQCLLNKETNCYINQICETTITGYATFCIARNALSTVFLACDPPPNIPNQTINYDKDPVIPSTMTSNMKSSTNNKPQSTINSSTLGSPIEFSKLTSNPSTSKLQSIPNSDPHSIRSSCFPTMPNMNNIANKPIVPLNESNSPRLASNCTVKAPLIKVNLNVNAQESIMKQMIEKMIY